jgi:hypothetical protein
MTAAAVYKSVARRWTLVDVSAVLITSNGGSYPDNTGIETVSRVLSHLSTSIPFLLASYLFLDQHS